METKPVVVSCELHWPFLNKPNEMSGKYQVDIGKLSSKAVDALSNMGIAVRNKGDDRGNFLTAKSSKYPITPYTTSGDEIHEKVANGSKASVLFDTYEWNFKNKTGVSMGIKKLIVTDLIPYEQEISEEDVEVL